MDTMGPFPRTTNCDRYILVFVDYLSRYTEIVPVTDRTSTSVAEALRRCIITPHGCPQTLLSDNALEFTSELFRKLCEFYQIKKVNIVAHKPSSNGLVEWTNRKIVEVLRTLVTPKTGDWDLSLDDIQLTINNTVNEATVETPHFLLYGVEWRMLYSLLDDSSPPLSYSSYGEYISFRTRQAWDVIRKTRSLLKDAFKRVKCKYDWSSQEHRPKVGQKAYVLKPFKEGPLYKASRKFDGPFRIVEVLKLNRCRLRHVSTLKDRVEHINNLKLIAHDVDYSFVKSLDDSDEERMSKQSSISFQGAEGMSSDSRYILRSRNVQRHPQPVVGCFLSGEGPSNLRPKSHCPGSGVLPHEINVEQPYCPAA